MIAIDTNVLIAAHREDNPAHSRADARLAELAESGRPWALPWHCLHEFVAMTTHPRIFKPPTPPADALVQVEKWLRAPAVTVLAEMEGYWELFGAVVRESGIAGPKVHDARIATLCRQHGVRVLWTADRDFSRFPWLKTQNPLVG